MESSSGWFSDDEALVLGLRRTSRHWASPIDIPGYENIVETHRGGQGVVYRAWHPSTKRTVAIKVLLDGALTSDAARVRFSREVELVAALDHPNIVRIYDSGVTADGHLYHVMEFVAGLRVDVACQKYGYDLNRRLKLFAQICGAVNHAHQFGIIHRDLKPDNILVDEAGAPHVLDFGLAKYAPGFHDAVSAGPTVSRTGQFLGSLAWASPEQIERPPTRVDLRTDVYSLGVILYQLITGRLPHDVSNDLRETVNQITTGSPPPIRSLCRSVPDDVETIALRCLAKDPEHRYQTVGDLVRDLDRYLTGRPIEAKRDRSLYVVGKILARHKALTALASLLVLALVVFAATMTVLHARVAAAEARARDSLARTRSETARAETVHEFLRDMLALSDPLVSADHSLTVRQMLDAASQTIGRRFVDHPDEEVEIRMMMGGAYYSLGVLDAAEVHDRRALEILRSLPNADPMRLAHAIRNLGIISTDRRDFEQADRLLQEALEIAATHAGPRSALTADVLLSLAELRQAQFRFPEAQDHYARACEIYDEQLGRDDRRTIVGLIQWAGLLVNSGEFEAAEARLDSALEGLRRHADEGSPLECGALLTLGMVKYNSGDFEGAEDAVREAIECQRRVFGDEHPRLAAMYNYMGHIRRDQARPVEAERWYRKALAVCENQSGRESPEGASALWNLARALWNQGRRERALPLFREAIAIRRRVFAPDHHLVQASLCMFALLLREAEMWRDAVPLLEEVTRTRAALYGENHPLTARSSVALGECLMELGRLEEAEDHLLSAHAALAADPGTPSTVSTPVLASIERLYSLWRKPREAARFRCLRVWNETEELVRFVRNGFTSDETGRVLVTR